MDEKHGSFGKREALAIQNEIGKRKSIEVKRPEGEIREILSKYYQETDNWHQDIVAWAQRTDGLPNGPGPSTRGNLTHPSALNILRNILAVNPSKIIQPKTAENSTRHICE
jgi:hypothetical protein